MDIVGNGWGCWPASSSMGIHIQSLCIWTLFALLSLIIRKIKPIAAKSQISFGGTYFILFFFLFRFSFLLLLSSVSLFVAISSPFSLFLSGCPPFLLHPTSPTTSFATTTSPSLPPSPHTFSFQSVGLCLFPDCFPPFLLFFLHFPWGMLSHDPVQGDTII